MNIATNSNSRYSTLLSSRTIKLLIIIFAIHLLPIKANPIVFKYNAYLLKKNEPFELHSSTFYFQAISAIRPIAKVVIVFRTENYTSEIVVVKKNPPPELFLPQNPNWENLHELPNTDLVDQIDTLISRVVQAGKCTLQFMDYPTLPDFLEDERNCLWYQRESKEQEIESEKKFKKSIYVLSMTTEGELDYKTLKIRSYQPQNTVTVRILSGLTDLYEFTTERADTPPNIGLSFDYFLQSRNRKILKVFSLPSWFPEFFATPTNTTSYSVLYRLKNLACFYSPPETYNHHHTTVLCSRNSFEKIMQEVCYLDGPYSSIPHRHGTTKSFVTSNIQYTSERADIMKA